MPALKYRTTAWDSPHAAILAEQVSSVEHTSLVSFD
jgi:hypothetical protein